MQERYSEEVKSILEAAQQQAVMNYQQELACAHLLVALSSSEGFFKFLLANVKADEKTFAQEAKALMQRIPSVKGQDRQLTMSTALARVIGLAAQAAGQGEVNIGHLVAALASDGDSDTVSLLKKYGIDKKKAEGLYMAYTNGQADEESKQTLEKYGQDLTAKAMDGKLDPVIGRDEEIRRVIEILSRRKKNNPVLIGEPGVGKTAIAEGLARRIVAGDVPENLKNKTLYALDLAALVAGAKYRGEFEERLKKVLKVISDSAGQIIMFIDELHTVVGAGAAEGAMDAGNILKPMLARGELRCIGATTLNEYRKYIEKDSALERRFQPVSVEEPTQEQCRKILEGLKEKYETHHKVVIEEKALEAAVLMSERYITDRHLPDKAIDVLDEACSKVSLKGYKVPENFRSLEDLIKDLEKQKEDSIVAGDFAEASLIQKEQDEARKKLSALKKRFDKKQAGLHPSVTENEVAEVVSVWTKVPVSKLTESDTERLKNLEKILQKRVIGQDEAVSAVARAVKRGRVGLKDPKRPIGSFLFLGPTGVGKTELSKALAEALFGKEEAMIRVDMSEYMEKHSVSKMIGSPPGYVGHEEGGQLSDQVRTHPYSVLLFDEIEKAHPDVFNVLLQVLDDGHITDSQGRKVDFSNTVIIMTSNAGAKAIIDPKKLGFAAKEDKAGDYKKMKQGVMEEVKQIFRPEFLNRIDEMIVFHTLDKENMKKIVSLLCNEFTGRLEKQMNIHLKLRNSAKELIVEKGTDTKYGARPLRRALQTELEDKLADAILNGDIRPGDHVEAGASKKEIHFFIKSS